MKTLTIHEPKTFGARRLNAELTGDGFGSLGTNYPVPCVYSRMADLIFADFALYAPDKIVITGAPMRTGPLSVFKAQCYEENLAEALMKKFDKAVLVRYVNGDLMCFLPDVRASASAFAGASLLDLFVDLPKRAVPQKVTLGVDLAKPGSDKTAVTRPIYADLKPLAVGAGDTNFALSGHDDDLRKTREAIKETRVTPKRLTSLTLIIHSDGSVSAVDSVRRWLKLGERADKTFRKWTYADAAAFLRNVGCKSVMLKRSTKSVPMEALTKWLSGLVNEHSPVMKIISDPGFVE